MKISIIVAMDRNNIIGIDNDLPWRLSSDLKRFKAITMGKPIIMGRKTHESIGRPLPGRENIIITRDESYKAEGCTVIHNIDDLIVFCKAQDEIMIMGGAEIYRQTLSKADKLYLTEVHAEVDGNIVFPKLEKSEWEEVTRENHSADEKNEYDYSFVILEKVRSKVEGVK